MNTKLFAAALLAVLAAVGVALSALSWWAATAYAVLVVGLLVLAARKGPPVEDGRTCSCCTSTVFDPVEVR